jgi:hypothetical protein
VSAPEANPPKADRLVVGGAVAMVLCCAVGPAVVGAVAGPAIGGWLGIACAVALAAGAALLLHRRRGKAGC